MALTFKEKIFYQDQVESSLEILNKENLSIREKVATQDRLTEALEKLDAPADTSSAHPLYDQLVAGDFNDFTHEKFADMCGRIAAEENIPWEDLHQPIIVYVQENEPYGGYNSNAFEGESAAASAA